jgi:hypothetical protein
MMFFNLTSVIAGTTGIAKNSVMCFNTKQCCLVKSLITMVGWFVEGV